MRNTATWEPGTQGLNHTRYPGNRVLATDKPIPQWHHHESNMKPLIADESRKPRC